MKMQLRAPAIPLVTVDPYLSIWSMKDKLNEDITRHWTGKNHQLRGTAEIDGKTYCFMGLPGEDAAMEQVSVDWNALSTFYVFTAAGVELKLTFTSPMLVEDVELMSRPVSYIKAEAKATDGGSHTVKVSLVADDEMCENFKYEFPTAYTPVSIPGLACARVGSVFQHPLNKSGDDLRINWGYLYGAVSGKDAAVAPVDSVNEYGTPAHDICLSADVSGQPALFAIAYDDIHSLEYFHQPVDGCWRKADGTVEKALEKAFADYDAIYARCESFAKTIWDDAMQASGNEKYAELLSLAYRQVIGAHKACYDTEGNVLFVSKECFSNGCAATVDVTYPSIPLFLIYNPELVKGMLRPVFKYAATDNWFYDFAPHDAGCYPLVNGQVYSHGTCPQWQMPVEECGNMLVTTAAVAAAEKDAAFAEENWEALKQWCAYLLKEGYNPGNQLCTDDFAGHLAHNCNLSLKAIMGIASFGILCKMTGRENEAETYMDAARKMAADWQKDTAEGDGTFRLAFDQPGTYSMKYNVIWDQLFGTGLFPAEIFKKELKINLERHANPYGLPLDNRADYTKSDWLVWSACLSDDKADFDNLIERLWQGYNVSESRVPMTDWYDTKTAKMIGFQHRTVQGGLYMKVLMDKKTCALD